MARHRNVRSMKYEDEFFDEDDMYGHSVEDSYCVSPGTAAQFTFNRDDQRHVELSSYMDVEGGIPEEDEEGLKGDGETPDSTPRSARGSLDYTRPQLTDVDEAKLNSCLEEIRNIVGESVPEHILVDTIVKHQFSLETSLNELLNQQEAPKPQRQPRQNRRNRSQAAVKTDTAATLGAAGTESLEASIPISSQVNIGSPSRVSGPTVILKHPKPKTVIAESAESSWSLPRVSVSDKTINQSTDSKNSNRTTNVAQTQAGNAAVDLGLVKTAIIEPCVEVRKDDIDAGDNVLTTVQSDNGAVLGAAGKGESDKETLTTPKKERFIPPLPKSASRSKYDRVDLKAEYEKRRGGKDMLNLVVIGHVDAGKSTLMGHLLYQLGTVSKRLMHKYEQESKKQGKSSFAYAWVLDETEEERARGVTMDIAQTKFVTPNKIITLLDAPGHKDFIPNMITGTAQADVAILVVNATKGEFETGFESGGQTREHALLARSLGVSQFIVAINKMDTVKWLQSRYDDIVLKLGLFLKQVGFKDADTAFIPVSGLSGENLTGRITEPQLSQWYRGSTLVEQIDKFRPVVRPVDKPLRICVSDVFKGMGSGFSVNGKLASGSVQLGDRAVVMPAGDMVQVKGLIINEEAVNFAFAGDHVTAVITGMDITHIGIGSMLCEASVPVKCATRIRARIVLFNLEMPMTRGCTVIVHYQSITEPAIVKKLVCQLNKSTGEVVKNKPKCLTKNMSAVIEIEFERPVCVELYKDNKELGRFMLRYSGHTIAAGLIEEVLMTKTGVVADSLGGASAY